MIWMIIWIGSSILTLILAARAGLNRPAVLAFGNLILPFIGLLYTLYLIHIYLPRSEGRIPPVMIFTRVLFEELSKSFKNWRAERKNKKSK